MKIGVRSEDKGPWERRTPLVPADAARLRAAGLEIVVQSSARRAFSDAEYRAAGVPVRESLDDCEVIVGIKEIPPEKIEPGKTYLFFPHVIKGQAANMPMLRRILEQGATLVDYERIVDEHDRRLIFFGRHAGLAGMINTLWALGLRLEEERIPSPFAALRQARTYASLEAAEEDLRRAAQAVAARGVPPEVHPLVVGFTGTGNVSRGAQEILDRFPVEEIRPEELREADAARLADPRRIYKAVFAEEDLFVPKTAGATFDLADYYRRGAEGYRSVFESFLPRLVVWVNGVYWDARYPRLLTLEGCRRLWGPGPEPRLRVIGDISCDVRGAVECTLRATDPGDPLYVYEPESGAVREGVRGRGPVIMAVDILPAEIPRESSTDFSRVLSGLLPPLAECRPGDDFAALRLPPALKRAVIAYRGALTPAYAGLAKFL